MSRAIDTPQEPTISSSAQRSVAHDLAATAHDAGISRVHLLAWRDLDDIEAGGSEVHAAEIAKRWAEAGIDLTMRTSYAQGQTPEAVRDGYRVVRIGGRRSVFPGTIISEILHKKGECDAMVEVWNGVPFLTPVWFRGPRAAIVHHVHHNMWDQVLDGRSAQFGRLLEGTFAPPLYHRTPIVALSESTRAEIIELLGLPARNIVVAPPGIDPCYTPQGPKTRHPSIVAVGRLMPPKRFDEMIRIAVEVRESHPTLELVIVGDGWERPKLLEQVSDLEAEDWIRIAGHVTPQELLHLYRSSWLVASASTAEGWGMTLTEAAACGTPSVATRIAGHTDSVAEGKSGLLADSSREMVEKISRVIADDDLRTTLSEGALKHAADLSWDNTAAIALNALTQGTRSRFDAWRHGRP